MNNYHKAVQHSVGCNGGEHGATDNTCDIAIVVPVVCTSQQLQVGPSVTIAVLYYTIECLYYIS